MRRGLRHDRGVRGPSTLFRFSHRIGVGAIEVAQAGKLLKLTDLKSGSLSFNYGPDDGASSNQADLNNDTAANDGNRTNPSAPTAKAIGSLTAPRSGTAVMA